MALFDASITNTPATPYFSSTSSSSPSSSSSSHFLPSNKQQKQINNRSNSPNSDHYDTPWEFKNRTLAAILGNQRQEQQQQLKNLEKQIEEKNTKNNEVNSPNFKNKNQRILNNEKEKYESEATIAIRKRLSFQGNSQKQKEELKIKNSSKQPIRQQISPKYFQNNKLANSLLEDNTKNGNQFNSNPQPNNSIKLKNDCSSKNNKESPPPLPAHKNNLQKQNSSKFPLKTPLSPIKSNLSSNNQNLIKFGDKQQQKQNLLDCQKEKTNCLSSNIQQEINKLKEIKEDKKQKQLSTNIKQRSAPSRKYPLVNLTTKNKINISNNKNEVFTFCQENSLGEEEKLINLVHEQLERAEAELLLGAMPLGSHLLRRRPDRSLALSLKANEGVLHIKLEYRCDRWVLGEGPRFNTVIEMLRAYRRVELPVRGAEQIRLTILFRPGDMPGRGLLLL